MWGRPEPGEPRSTDKPAQSERTIFSRKTVITDISLIGRLTGLTRLDLHVNQVSNISPLAGLTNLTWLNLHRNKIADLSPFAGLTNLTWLDVSNNEITDLSPLDEIRDNLNTLFYHGNFELLKNPGPK